MAEEKLRQMQAISDPHGEYQQQLDTPEPPGRSVSAPDPDNKNNGQLRVQFSVSRTEDIGSQDMSLAPRAQSTPDLTKRAKDLSQRIQDAQGNLVFNRTKSEVTYEQELERKITDMSISKKACTFEEWESLIELQCPLPPRAYKYLDETDQKEKQVHTTARLYHGKFWIRHPDTGIIYEAITKPKDIKKHQKRLDQMRAVDEYLDHFKLTSSVEIYKRFKRAVGFLEDSTMKKSEKKKAEIAYKLIPGWQDRFSFFGTLLRALLNAYFIYFNLEFAFQEKITTFWFWGIMLTAGAEAYLFLVAFLRTLYNTKSLVERLLQNDTVHFQTKNMPMQIREMAQTSILRFLPSGQSTNRLRKRWKENFDEILEDYRFAVENARKHKLTVKIRESIHIGFLVIGPLLAVLALMFKVASLSEGIAPDTIFGEKFHKNFIGWVANILIPYLGFVNQIAGIRKVRLIEMYALQHFVFSGNDVKLSKHERQMMNVWWNFTVVSCVSNISDKFKYPTFDSIVFWYQLNPRKLQILMKNHDAEGVDFLKTTKDKDGRRKIQTPSSKNYDSQVFKHASKRRLKKDTQSQNTIITQTSDVASEDDEEEIITTVTMHKKISENIAEVAATKQNSQDIIVQVNDNSDATDETAGVDARDA